MMNIEDQVCNLELAARLKKLKVKQKSIYHWARLDERRPYDDFELVDLFENEKKKYPYSFTERISAFTVAELLQIRFNQVGSFAIVVNHYKGFADTLAKKIIKWLENK